MVYVYFSRYLEFRTENRGTIAEVANRIVRQPHESGTERIFHEWSLLATMHVCRSMRFFILLGIRRCQQNGLSVTVHVVGQLAVEVARGVEAVEEDVLVCIGASGDRSVAQHRHLQVSGTATPDSGVLEP